MSYNTIDGKWENDLTTEDDNELVHDSVNSRLWPVVSYDKWISPKLEFDGGFNFELNVPEGVDLDSAEKEAYPYSLRYTAGQGALRSTKSGEKVSPLLTWPHHSTS